MPIWPKDNDAELDAFYGGRPDGSAKWEVTNLVYVFTPWKSYLAGTNTPLLRGIRVHKKVADSLARIFAEIWALCGQSQKKIEELDLHQIGGFYYFRPRRESKRISNHGRGIAGDLDPEDNVMRKNNRGDMDAMVIRAFQKEKWRWGGEYGDPMHFEAVWSELSNRIAAAILVAPVAQPVKVVAETETAQPNEKWTITPATISLIKRWESFVDHAYNDRGSLAIGYGHTAKIGPPVVTADMKITEPKAADMLLYDLTLLAGTILPLIKVALTPNQLGAVLAFTYNVGRTAFVNSTFLKRINKKDFHGATEAMQWFKKSTNPVTKVKEILAGLVARRADEAKLFLTP